MKFLRRLPIAPLLLALYSVLALLANNIDQMSAGSAIRSLAISLIGAAAILGAFILVFRNWHRAALAASLVVFLFFSYGHIYGLLKQVEIFSVLVGRHRFLIPIWIGLIVVGLYVVSMRIQHPISLSGPMNLVAGLLVLVPLSTVAIFIVRSRRIQPLQDPENSSNCDLALPTNTKAPDIYYIILDAYARADDLQDVYHFDNSIFLEDLSESGFYVAEWSQSNYSSTLFSVTSSLNMDYLQSLDERIYNGAPYDVAPVWHLLGENAVRQNLECLGYKVVAFDSGWHALGWRDADVYLGPEATSFVEGLELSRGINEFESMLLQSSATLIFTDAATVMPKFLEIDTSGPFQYHRLRMLYQLDSLENTVPAIEGPKFVFAHILATHKPYVFGPGGEQVELEGLFTLADTQASGLDAKEVSAYSDQVNYINLRMKNLIKDILEASETPPIIIIQSDHGAEGAAGRRLNILNALYLPDVGDELLYSTITPINTFRVVFSSYFSADYSLLDDISYSSPYESFDFTIVPNEHATN